MKITLSGNRKLVTSACIFVLVLMEISNEIR